ncbi:hypothetical protein ISCGN_005568 [Ixodes scapularis]
MDLSRAHTLLTIVQRLSRPVLQKVTASISGVRSVGGDGSLARLWSAQVPAESSQPSWAPLATLTTVNCLAYQGDTEARAHVPFPFGIGALFEHGNMRAVLLCYLLLVGVLVTDAQESCLDRRVLLKTGKEYLKSLLAKLVPDSVRDFLRSLPPPDFKSAQEMQRP